MIDLQVKLKGDRTIQRIPVHTVDYLIATTSGMVSAIDYTVPLKLES